MGFYIREVTRKDIPSILSLVKALADYENLRHQVQVTPELLELHGFGEKPRFYTLIAENEKRKAVGFALYFFTFSTFTGKPTLYLEDLFVLPDSRGNGIGKSLLAKLANIASEKDCGRMEWSVLDWNEPAIRFYRALGAELLTDWRIFRLMPDQFELLT